MNLNIIKVILIVFAANIALAFADNAQNSKIFKKASRQKTLVFPQDHGAHPNYKTEWWYYTGNLYAPNGRRFGYQLTFFRNSIGSKPGTTSQRSASFASNQLYLSHFAISDLSKKIHYSAERIVRGHPKLASASSQPFSISVDGWSIEGKHPGSILMKAKTQNKTINYSLTLNLEPIKNLVLQGQEGFSQKGDSIDNASHYYSYSRLKSKGELTIGNKRFDVTGESWMDHEFSTSILEETQKGWDWFSIQLNNNTELMLFQLRDSRGQSKNYYSGLLIKANNQTRVLNMKNARFNEKKIWTSKRTNTPYPARWQLDIPNEKMRLDISASLDNQEMKTSVPYWEGAIDVEAEINGVKLSGIGFMELTGYGESIQKRFR